jgi:flagellar L-ring protein FlgH
VNSMSAGVTGLFDLQKVLKGGTNTDLSNAGMENDHNFEADGATERGYRMFARVSCIVTEVLPNGNLRIEGRQDITINYENQFILISGIVRTENISSENTIQSYQIADARIDYSGDGDLDDQQRPSWLNRLFSTINIL